MNTTIFTVVAAGAALALLSIAPASADTMNAMVPQCTTADSHVAMMAMPAPMPSPSGNLDKDAAAEMMSLDKMMMHVATTEAACGKNPSERAMARKMVTEMKQHISVLNPFVQLTI